MLKSYFAIRRHLLGILISLLVMELLSGFIFFLLGNPPPGRMPVNLEGQLVAPMAVAILLTALYFVFGGFCPPMDFDEEDKLNAEQRTLFAVCAVALSTFLATAVNFLTFSGMGMTAWYWGIGTVSIMGALLVVTAVSLTRARDRIGNDHTKIRPVLWVWPGLFFTSIIGMTAFHHLLPWLAFWSLVAVQAILFVTTLVGRQKAKERRPAKGLLAYTAAALKTGKRRKKSKSKAMKIATMGSKRKKRR